MKSEETPYSKGGKARAESLTPEQKKTIARNAALTRWGTDVPVSQYMGEFNIGNTKIFAVVLPNGKRVIAQSTFLRALGRSRSPKAGMGVLSTVDGIPFFLQAEILKPFIDSELLQSTTPIFFKTKEGRGVGYDAELLPKVAEVYLKMRDQYISEGKPVPSQFDHIVRACDIIIRGLATVGIVALVDEATGYQDFRARDALARILEAFVAKELKKWVKTFPLEYFKQLCRIRNIAFSPTMKLPPYFGKLTNNLIYSRLAPGVLEELKHKNPTNESGRRKHKHFQWLTSETGHPKLLEHLSAIVALMKVSNDWDQFKNMVDKALPVYHPLPLFDEAEKKELI